MRKLIITRGGRIDELVPEEGGKPNRWRMRRPIDAPADTRAITQILAILANLRAEGFVADTQERRDQVRAGPAAARGRVGDRSPHRLKVGAQVPREPSYYAAIGRRAVRLHPGRRDLEAV